MSDIVSQYSNSHVIVQISDPIIVTAIKNQDIPILSNAQGPQGPQGTIPSTLLVGDGTFALPSYSFITDPNSGFYRIGEDNIGLSLSGSKVLDISTTGLGITGTLTLTGTISGQTYGDWIYKHATSKISNAFVSNGGLGLYGAGNIGLLVDGVEKVRVNSTGDLGVGTSTPTSRLHVYKTSGTYTTKFENSGSDNYNQFISASGTGEYGIFGDAFYFQALDTLANGVRFYGSSTNRVDMQISNAGNVGIGTALPTTKLHIVQVSDTISGGLSIVNSGTSGSGRIWVDGNGVLKLDAGSGAGNPVSIANSTVHILSGGNVGIGTTSPNAKLDVSGGSIAVDKNSQFQFRSATSGALSSYIGTNSPNDLIFAPSTVEAVRILANGNVGVGNASPSYPLDVTGNLRATNYVYADAALNSPLLIYAGSTDLGIEKTGAYSIKFSTNGTERARINPSGHFLVGAVSTLGGADKQITVSAGTSGDVVAALNLQGSRTSNVGMTLISSFSAANEVARIQTTRVGAAGAKYSIQTRLDGSALAETVEISTTGVAISGGLSTTGVVSLTSSSDHYIKEGVQWMWNSTGASGGATRGGIYGMATGGLKLNSNGSGSIDLTSIGAAITGVLSSTSHGKIGGEMWAGYSGSNDHFVAVGNAAGSGITLIAYNFAHTDWCPVIWDFKTSFKTRHAGTTVTEVTSSGLTLTGALDIVHSGLPFLKFTRNGTTKTYFGTGDGSSLIASAAAGDTALRAEQALVIATGGGTEHARITSAGYLGIGTAAPYSILNAYGSSGLTLNLSNSAWQTAAIKPIDEGSSYQGAIAFCTHATAGAAGAATERMRLDSAGNLGLGVAPRNTTATVRSFELTAGSLTSYSTTTLNLSQNNAGDDKYIIAAAATSYQQASGVHKWWNAGSGAAGAAIPFTQAMTLHASGGLSLGNTTDPGVGNLSVTGNLSAATKSFLIDHPTKPDHKLRHGSLEGPENGIYVRGRCTSNFIDLPEYWTKLIDPLSITVTLTSIGSHQDLYVVSTTNNKVEIANASAQLINCFYIVYAERVDVDKLIVEIPI